MPKGPIRCSFLLLRLSLISPTMRRRFSRASARNLTRTNRTCAVFQRARREVEKASAARRFPHDEQARRQLCQEDPCRRPRGARARDYAGGIEKARAPGGGAGT